jgi:hypothetical protein
LPEQHSDLVRQHGEVTIDFRLGAQGQRAASPWARLTALEPVDESPRTRASDKEDRIFQPAAVAVGLPEDTIPRDLRGSFASLLIYERLNVLEVAPQLGHKPSTCLDIYGRLFEEFDAAQRRPAVEVIREARKAVRAGALPTGYPAGPLRSDQDGRATAERDD